MEAMTATGCGQNRRPGRRATIETMAHRHCLWSCKVCNYMKNKDHATYCEICGAVAPRTRFGMKVEGRHYLCYVKKALSHENDHLVLLDTCPAKGAMLKIHLSLDVSTTDLEERIARTLAAFRKHFNVIVWGENPDDDVVYDVEALTASQRMRVAERTLSMAEVAAVSAALEDADEERPPSPQAINNGNINGLTSLLAALASPYAEDGKEKKEDNKRPINPASAGSTLFDKVVAECRTQVYDTVLGSFLPKTHPVVRAAIDDPTGLSAHLMYGLETDFNFVKGMVKERDAMAQKVVTEAHLRHTMGAGSLVNALRPAEEEAQDRPRKLKVEVLYAESKLPRDFSEPCSLCERRYHPRNLVGLVPFRAVVRWKEAHGMTLNPEDRRLRLDNVYEDSRLCVFCTQYFDTDFGEYFCYHRGKTECKDPVLLMEGNREGSNLDPQVSQQLQEFIKNPRPADNPFIRPYSRLSLGLNILQLRLRRDMPERMADVGCELARYSNLQHDLKKSRNTLALQLAKRTTVNPKKMTASGERLYGASLRLQASRKKAGQGPVVFTDTLRRSEKKAEEAMLATMDRPEWAVASASFKKAKRALPSILAGNDAALPSAARGAEKLKSPHRAAHDVPSPPKKAIGRRAKQPPQAEELMDIQLDDDDEEEEDSDVRIVGRNGERKQARPKGAERPPAYAEPDDWRAAEWQRRQQQEQEGDRLMDTQEYESREKVRVGKVVIVKGHSYHDDNVKLAKKIYV